MNNIFIHIGMHKTASTFLQKEFFPLYQDEIGYLSFRKELRNTLNYILHENSITYDERIAREILKNDLKDSNFDNEVLTLSDEQFCGSPWNNAFNRKLYFDRLNKLFPNAKYILIIRDQETITQSLYLQYIKTGGSANWKQFLSNKRHPLQFSLKGYLNYGDYYQYIIEQVGSERLLIICYENLLMNKKTFLKKFTKYLEVDIKDDVYKVLDKKFNRSIGGYNAIILRILNKIFSSEKQPFQLLPCVTQTIISKIFTRLPQLGRKYIIPTEVVKKFCNEPKRNNYKLPKQIYIYLNNEI